MSRSTPADVYALGATLYELATGRRVRSDTVGLDTATATPTADADAGDSPPPVQYPGAEWLASVLERCLDPEPRERFPSMAELASALRALPVTGPSLACVLRLPAAAPPPERRRTNLVADPAAFVGRDAELGELATLLGRPVLLTLKGPGGIGKTLLALELARRYHDATGEQAWFCDLSEARTPQDLLRSVSSALGVHGRRGDCQARTRDRRPGRRARHLRAAHREHGATSVRFVVTSREPLRFEGEPIVELSSLPVHDAVALLSARALARGVDLSGESLLVDHDGPS